MNNSKTFTLTIARVDDVLFQGDVVHVQVPGNEGELTILKNHEPLVTTLRRGTIRVLTTDSTKNFDVVSGVLETSNGQVTILV